MTEPWKYQLDEAVTVEYPSGRIRDGWVARRRRMRLGDSLVNRYTILFTDDSADPEVIPEWVHPRQQRALPI